jgi:hypothetical protein
MVSVTLTPENVKWIQREVIKMLSGKRYIVINGNEVADDELDPDNDGSGTYKSIKDGVGIRFNENSGMAHVGINGKKYTLGYETDTKQSKCPATFTFHEQSSSESAKLVIKFCLMPGFPEMTHTYVVQGSL